MAYVQDDYGTDDLQAGSSRDPECPEGTLGRGSGRHGDDVFPGDGRPNMTRSIEGERVELANISIGIEESEGNGFSDDGQETENRSVYKLITAIVVAVVLVWLSSMLTPMVRNVCESNGWGRVAAVVWLLIPLTAIGYAVVQGWRVFCGLSPSVKVKASEYLGRERDRGSKLDLKSLLMSRYLPHFPLDPKCKAQIGDDAFGRLKVLKEDRQVLPDDWLDDFKAFQDELCEVAKVVVEDYAGKVGLGTAASTSRRFDIVITLFLSAQMLMAVANLFRHRMTRLGALKTVIFWSFNLWVSGQLQRVVAKAVQGAANIAGVGTAASVVLNAPEPSVALLAERAAKGVVAKAAGMVIEGGVNRILARKLGEMAIREFLAVDWNP